MTPTLSSGDLPRPRRSLGPFRRAVLHGLAVLLPPLLTIVIFFWVGNTVVVHLLEPLERSIRWVMVEKFADIRSSHEFNAPPNQTTVATTDDQKFQRIDDGRYVPEHVYRFVEGSVGKNPMPDTAKGIYTWYVDHRWLPRRFVVPFFLCVFLLVLYLLGKFLAAGAGRFFWSQLERLINRVPLVRNVYSSVKQVTDFFITEPDIQYTRVVAIEYPRKGIWTVAFATGDGMWEICGVTKEPMLTVFVPTSPMPFTGFALTVKKSEVIDLSLTVDQAIQFMVSCGVVIPPPPADVAVADTETRPADRPLMLTATTEDDD